MLRNSKKDMNVHFVTAGDLLDKMSDPSVKSFKILEIAADMNSSKMREMATNHGFAIMTKTKDLMRPKSTTWLHFQRYS